MSINLAPGRSVVAVTTALAFAWFRVVQSTDIPEDATPIVTKQGGEHYHGRRYALLCYVQDAIAGASKG